MWRNFISFGKIIRLCLLAVLLSLPYSGACSAEEAAAQKTEQQETVTLSAAQWEELKKIIAEQDNFLTTLEKLLEGENGNLNQLLCELSEAKKSLRILQSELENAKESLKLADRTLQEQNESLAKLSAQIKKERAINNREKWQHTFWGVIIGVVIGTATTH